MEAKKAEEKARTGRKRTRKTMESQKPGNEANDRLSVEASCNVVEQSAKQLQRSHVEKYILSTMEAQTLMKTPIVCVWFIR